jgi:Tfp pilus assembly protein PilF
VLEPREVDSSAAVDALTQAILDNPRDATAWKARGLALADQGQFELAASDFVQALRLDPNPAIRYCRGVAYLRMGEAGMAVAEFTNALMLDPGFLDAIVRRAEAFRTLGDRNRAAIDDKEVRRLRRLARTRQVAEASQQEAREVPLKTA